MLQFLSVLLPLVGSLLGRKLVASARVGLKVKHGSESLVKNALENENRLGLQQGH